MGLFRAKKVALLYPYMIYHIYQGVLCCMMFIHWKHDMMYFLQIPTSYHSWKKEPNFGILEWCCCYAASAICPKLIYGVFASNTSTAARLKDRANLSSTNGLSGQTFCNTLLLLLILSLFIDSYIDGRSVRNIRRTLFCQQHKFSIFLGQTFAKTLLLLILSIY